MYLNAMQLPQRHPWFAKSAKRKQPDSAPSHDEPRATKRRRSLEHGFANMSLEPQPRPATPPITEIVMKPSTWYEREPDRIVITDLENYSDDEPDTPPDAPDAPVIPPSILKALTTRPLIPPCPAPDSRALVLFRPLVSQIKADKADDDAMDIEP